MTPSKQRLVARYNDPVVHSTMRAHGLERLVCVLAMLVNAVLGLAGSIGRFILVTKPRKRACGYARSKNAGPATNGQVLHLPRVVMFMREFYPLTGGYQNQALRLAQALLERKIPLRVVTHRHGRLPAYEVYNGIPIHRVAALEKGHLAAFSFLASSFLWMTRNRHSFDLIHANRSSSGLIAGLIGLTLGKKVIYKLTRGDEIDIKGFRSTLWGSLKLRYLTRTVHKFVAITSQIETDLSYLGVPSSKIVRIPNGISLDRQPVSYGRKEARSQLGWSSDEKIVLFLGRLVDAKGVDWLLETWREVASQETKARLVIGGDGPERQALETQAQKLGITHTVYFVGSQKDVWKFFAAADVFTLPSRREGISNALLEAMSQGVPTVVADDSLGGNRETVEHGKNGYLLTFGETENYAATLVELLRDAKLRREIGERGRRTIQERYSIERVADRYLETYYELLQTRARRNAADEKPSVGLFLPRPDRSHQMARKLRERGFGVAHYNTGGSKDGGWIPVRKGFMPALAHLLFRTNHDVYFAALSFIPSLSVCFNRFLRGKPYVFNATGVKSEMYKDRSRGKPFASFFERRFYPFLMELVFAGASKIVCNSHFLESTLAARYPRYRSRLLTIYNGIDCERYSSGCRNPIPGINAGELTLLCVTSLNFENKSRGLQLVIDAFGQLSSETTRGKLVIAAMSSDPLYQKQAEDYLNSKPWRDAILLFYNHQRIPDLLASADIFVYATPHNSNDSLPRALLEAQSAGLPAVTTDTTGCPEIVRDGITGLVVPYKAAAMADAIRRLVADPQLRSEMGRQAREWIRKNFSWDEMADQYAKVFLEIAGKKTTRNGKKACR